ncbi:MAG: 3-oxoacyl-ACP reductase FabG [Pseudomonadota bacterium]
MKRILVTGASRGIGAAVASQLAADGFAVTVHYGARADRADAVAQAIRDAGGTAQTLGFDLADRATVTAALGDDLERNGAYWGVVLNAGVTADQAFPMLEEDEWDRVLRTNLDGFFAVLKPLVMPMIRARNGGRIVVMTSVSGLSGNRGQTNYAASKAGLIGAAKSLALELAKRKITVNCVAPGVIETDMTEALPTDWVTANVPLRRPGQVEEVAGLVSYLCSPGAAYITRQVIAIDGGLSG